MADKDKQVEDEETASEEPIEVSTEEPEEEPERKTSETEETEGELEYVCSVCGATVVPQVYETDRGMRYRCPECGKFMKPLTPEEALDISEPAVEDEDYDDEILLPPDIAIVGRIKEILGKRLPRLYGISKSKQSGAVINSILDTITKHTIGDPSILHSHIKSFAKGVDDRHLQAIITKIYETLDDEGLLPRSDSYIPDYGQTGRYGQTQQQYSGLRRQLGIAEAESPRETRGDQMTIFVDGVPISVDHQGYLAYQRFQRDEERARGEKREHELRMQKLEAEIQKASRGRGDSGQELVEIPFGDGDKTIKIPMYLAPLYLKDDSGLKGDLEAERGRTDKEREKRHEAEQQRILDALERASDQPTFFQQLEQYKAAGGALGMSPTGKTTIDLVSSGIEQLDNRIAQVLERVGPGQDFVPQVTRTPREREQKAKDLMDQLDGSEEVIEAENELMTAAKKVSKSEEE